MKYLVASIVSISLMVSLCVLSSWLVIKAVDETTSLLEEAVAAEKSERKDDSLRIIREASQSWNRHQVFFGTVLRHDEIDEVIEEFARLESYATTQDQDDFLSNCCALVTRLEHIKSMEKPTFENIM